MIASDDGQPSLRFGQMIPMRDGVELSGTLYLPPGTIQPTFALFTMTPYIAQTYHEIALDFATHGIPILVADVRGRGNSGGVFTPYINEGNDGEDVLAWLASQPFCNGKVSMWGGSYSGFNQWATAARHSRHLKTIVPVAAPFPGVDFPLRGNIMRPYLMEWLTLVWGRAAQNDIFYSSDAFWYAKFAHWYRSGAPFAELDTFLGMPSAHFQNWVAHPEQGEYWDQCNARPDQYGQIDIPILTITGMYDGDQAGALHHYREHITNSLSSIAAQHFLVIGPWDHAGTRNPKRSFEGIHIGDAAMLDMRALHRDWYRWTMANGPRPTLLKDRVAYYVTQAEEWRHAPSLEAITDHFTPLYLEAWNNPTDVFRSGDLSWERQAPPGETFSTYVFDPRDTRIADWEDTPGAGWWVDQRTTYASLGDRLIFHSAPFSADADICGFFTFLAWVAIDQPDTDFEIKLYEVLPDGSAILLGSDAMRARYRNSLRNADPVKTPGPLLYRFNGFPFIARTVRRGSRLRLVFGALNSMHSQRNGNTGGVVAAESVSDSRTVTVRLYHDRDHPAVLEVPFGSRAFADVR